MIITLRVRTNQDVPSLLFLHRGKKRQTTPNHRLETATEVTTSQWNSQTKSRQAMLGLRALSGETNRCLSLSPPPCNKGQHPPLYRPCCGDLCPLLPMPTDPSKHHRLLQIAQLWKELHTHAYTDAAMSIFRLSCFSIAHLAFTGLRCFMGALKFESLWKMNELVVPCSLRLLGLYEEGNPETEQGQVPSLLDLPELTLECVLEKLSPTGLCSMSAVCSSLRDSCRSDHLWEKHVEQKWAGVIGDAARAEWDHRIAVESRQRNDGSPPRKGLRDMVCSFRKKLWGNETKRPGGNPLPPDSVMALYLSLENGKFWFPAQVYNRENGHSGFMLSCYDAHICYDSPTDTFQARYSSHGVRGTVEESVPWNRIRSPPVSTPPSDLHVSDCLDVLKPGDHIEIQWRKSKEFPYGWWYGAVGHLESCSGTEECCHCIYNDRVMLEFNHYPTDSRWRRKVVHRKKHPEEDDEVTGFYGGIRKLHRVDEITKWKSLWPSGFSE